MSENQSAETLREAASLMRERAEAALASAPGDANWHAVSSLMADGKTPRDAEHIASWHPAVALAVADWLESEVNEWGDLPHMLNPHALAVARAYLGSES